MFSTCLILCCLASNIPCLRSCAWCTTMTTTTTMRAYIFIANLRGWHCRKERRRQKDSRPTRVITSSRGLNIIIIIARERKEFTVRRRRRRRFSTHVIRGGGGRTNGALNRFYRAITVRAIVRHYLETSLSILHGRVWMKGKKFPAPARTSARLLASHIVVFGELCSCS